MCEPTEAGVDKGWIRAGGRKISLHTTNACAFEI